jgi:signal transduction histidine kinase
VADTGPGIRPEDVPLLFEKYKQTRTRTTQGEPGTGLGLAIVRQLVELHGGHVAVTSQVNQGSVFTVYLPAGNPARVRHLPDA